MFVREFSVFFRFCFVGWSMIIENKQLIRMIILISYKDKTQ